MATGDSSTKNSNLLAVSGFELCESCLLLSVLLLHSHRNRLVSQRVVSLGGSDGKESAYNAGDLGSIPRSSSIPGLGAIPGLGRSPGEGNGNPLQYSCLENSMDRGAWRATVHRLANRHNWATNTQYRGLFSLRQKKWFRHSFYFPVPLASNFFLWCYPYALPHLSVSPKPFPLIKSYCWERNKLILSEVQIAHQSWYTASPRGIFFYEEEKKRLKQKKWKAVLAECL